MKDIVRLDEEMDERAQVRLEIQALREKEAQLNEKLKNSNIDDREVERLIGLALPYAQEEIGMKKIESLERDKDFWILREFQDHKYLAISNEEELYIVQNIEPALSFILGAGVLTLGLVMVTIVAAIDENAPSFIFPLFAALSVLFGYILYREVVQDGPRYVKWEDGKLGLTRADVAQILAQQVEYARRELSRRVNEKEHKLETLYNYRALLTD